MMGIKFYVDESIHENVIDRLIVNIIISYHINQYQKNLIHIYDFNHIPIKPYHFCIS